MKATLMGFMATLCSVFFFSSCSNNDISDGQARLQVRLTDDPANFDAVNIDVRDIQINVTGDDQNGWKSLGGVQAGIYDILELVNDKDTLLADAVIPTGRIHQIRLVLGDNNTLELDGETLALATPSAAQSGLKLNIQQDVTDGILYTILLDFDAARSIVHQGNGSYSLKPVIRTVLQAAGGSIRGVVTPDSVQTSIFAIVGADTVAGTFTDATGGFLIKGLAPATYNLSLVPGDTSFNTISVPGVVVSNGQVTSVDTVRFN